MDGSGTDHWEDAYELARRAIQEWRNTKKINWIIACKRTKSIVIF